MKVVLLENVKGQGKKGEIVKKIKEEEIIGELIKEIKLI